MSIFGETTGILLGYNLGLHLIIGLIIAVPILVMAIKDKALNLEALAYFGLPLLIQIGLGLLSFGFSLILISLVRWVLGLCGIVLENDMIYVGVYIVLDLIRLFMFRNWKEKSRNGRDT